MTFDGVAATVSAVTSTSITASTPAHAAGAVVTNIEAKFSTLTGGYTYVVIPTAAEIGLQAAEDRSPLSVGVMVSIDLVKDAEEAGLPGTLLASYAADLTIANPTQAITTVCRSKALVTTPTCLIGDGGNGAAVGTVKLGGLGSAGAPLELAFVGLRLLGANDLPVDVTLTFTDITDSLGNAIAQDTSVTRTFLRGDSRVDGTITLSDALFIAQHMVNPVARPAGEGAGDLNPVNAGGVVHDGANEIITVADAVLIAQFLVWNHDEHYDSIT